MKVILRLATPATRERRDSPRLKVDSLVYLTIAPDNGGILHDLSESGMCVSMANPLGAVDDCQFSLVLQDHPPIQGVGHVAWLSESGKAVGLRFVHLPDDSRRHIRDWIQSNAAEAETVERASGPNRIQTENAEAAPLHAGAASSSSAETKVAAKKPQTPLFFLPQRQTDDAPEGEASPLQESSYPVENETDGVERVRLALAQAPDEPEEKKTSQDWFFVIRAVCIAVLALVGGLLLVFNRGNALQYVKRVAAIPTATRSMTPAEHSSTRRTHATRTRPHSSSPPRDDAGERHVTTPRIWTQASGRAAPFQLEVTDSFHRHWLVSASGQKMLSSNGAEKTGGNASASAGSEGQMASSAGESAGPMAPTADLVDRGEAKASQPAAGARGDAPPVPIAIVPPDLGVGVESAPFTVVLDALIGKDGRVKDVHVLSSPSAALAWAVVEAVKQWRYPPFARNGQPSEVVTRITVSFKSPQKR